MIKFFSDELYYIFGLCSYFYSMKGCFTGVMRPDGSDTLMPIGRMPFGLLEHQIKFFACTNTQQVVNIIQLVVSFLSVKIKLIVNLLMICACFCHRVK